MATTTGATPVVDSSRELGRGNGAAQPPVSENEVPLIIDVPVDADPVAFGQVLHRGWKVPGNAGPGCDFDGITGGIVMTLNPEQRGGEITIDVATPAGPSPADRCTTVSNHGPCGHSPSSKSSAS